MLSTPHIWHALSRRLRCECVKEKVHQQGERQAHPVVFALFALTTIPHRSMELQVCKLSFKMVLNPPYGQMQRSVNVELDEFSSELRLLNNQSDTHCPLERCNQSRMWRPTHTHDRCMHRCLNATGWFTSSLQMLDFPITVIQMWCGF